MPTTARARRPRAWPSWATGSGRRAWSARGWRATGTASSSAPSRRPTRSAAGWCSTPRHAGTGAAPTRWPACTSCAAASARRRPGANRRTPPPQPPDTPLTEPAPQLPAGAIALAERLRAAGHEPPSTVDLGDAATHLPALREAGVAARVGRDRHAHVDALAEVRCRVVAIVEAEGAVTLA